MHHLKFSSLANKFRKLWSFQTETKIIQIFSSPRKNLVSQKGPNEKISNNPKNTWSLWKICKL